MMFKLTKNQEWVDAELNGELCQLPAQWQIRSVGEVCSLINGFSFKSTDFEQPYRLPIIRIRDLLKQQPTVGFASDAPAKAPRVLAGDLLIGMDGDFNIVEWTGPSALLNQRILKVVPRDDVHKEYLKQVLARELLKINLTTEYTTVKHLSAVELSEHQLACPSQQEQSRAGEALSAQVQQIRDLKSLIAKLETRLRYFSRELLSGRIRVKDVDGKPVLYRNEEWQELELNGEVLAIPANWQARTVGAVTQCLDSKRRPLNSTERSTQKGDVPYWGAAGVVDHVAGCLFDEELVLLGEDAAPFFDKTKSVAFYVNEPIWPNNHIHVLRATGILPQYLVMALNAFPYDQVLSTETRPKLTQSAMLEMQISTPPEEEQVSLTALLVEQEALITSYKSMLSAEQRRLAWLQENLLTGKYRLEEVPTEEVAVIHAEAEVA